jgi:periplasmic protein TonB
MDFSETERNPAKKLTGIAFVILLHVLIVYALVTGLARKVVEVIKQPVETKIIEEVKPPPPKDLPPPPPPPPKMVAPPPPFIPPPEVQIQQPPPQNAITAVTNVKPENPVMPAPQPAVTGNGPPATGPSRTAAVVDPSGCAKPEYPPKSLRADEQGTVVLQFLIGTDGRVVESKVERSSGFRALDNAARNALSLCKFKPGTVDGKPEQSWTKIAYDWKIE